MWRAIVVGTCAAGALLVGPASVGHAQVHIDIGLSLPAPPHLVIVPRTQVRYAPQVNENLFVYGNQYYWYRDNRWYVSARHDGPWVFLAPEVVPRPILAVPVRYYRHRPADWNGWRHDAPPHWKHAKHHRDDRWERR